MRLSERASVAPAKATERLALALMGRLGGNVVLSPDSVAAALAMAGTGARGTTATQIARVLHVRSPSSFASLGELQGAILEPVSTGSHVEAPTIEIANGLFVQQGYSLEDSFTSGLGQAFAAAPQPVDFTGAGAEEAINAWVKRQTHELIPHLVSGLSRETRLSLANAIYLKAKWYERFKPQASHAGPFHGEHGTTTTTFMHKTEPLPYGHGHGYAALSLPYGESRLSLLVLLPEEQTLHRLERRLSADMLDRIVRDLRKRAVRVSLPRFHLQTRVTLDDALKGLGMTAAFGPAADFTGITKAEPLQIGQVAHAADFKLDEAGTEAAGATNVEIEAVSAPFYTHPAVFAADRPFMFLLRDDRSGAVLFAGRLVTPQN